MKLLPTFLILVMLSLAVITLPNSASAVEDPCADGSCEPPIADPCADGACDPPDPCSDGSCEPPIVDPCADGACDPPDPCFDGSCELPAPSPPPEDGDDGDGDVTNNPPVITTFSVPATAYRNTEITFSVTATDNDGGVNRIEILKDSIVIAVQSCGNVISCTRSFIVRVPDAFDAVYTFVARVFDNDGASATATGNGRTNPAPAFEAVREPLRVSIPSDELFISSLVPDTGCLAPGDETFLYISLKNTGRNTLDDVKITAVVLDSDIRAVSGPFVIRKGDSASRFLYFIIPENTKPGEYYIKVAVTFGTDSVVKYRIFEISSAC